MADPINVKGPDLEGLLPAIDRRKVGKLHIVSGKNFVFDADGPKTPFGAEYATYDTITEPAYSDSFYVEDRQFIMTADAIMVLNDGVRQFIPIHIFGSNISSAPHRWTMAFVGGIYYFCHSGVGLISYTPSTELFAAVTSGVPAGAHSICDVNGRLVILGTSAYSWSAQDDGTNLTASLTTGAGSQATSILGGDTLMCLPYSSGSVKGVMVFTSRGIIRAEFKGNVGVFQHRVLTDRHKLINSFAAQELDTGEIVFVTKNGIMTTAGEIPTRWDDVFSEFLIKQFNEVYDTTLTGNVRLTFLESEQLIFVSFASGAATLYEFAYVVYLPMKRWGIFNKVHYSIFEMQLVGLGDAGRHWGYIDSDKHLLRWDGIPRIQTFPNGTSQYLFKPVAQYPVRYDVDNDVNVMPSVMHMGYLSEGLFVSGSQMGLYDIFFTEYDQDSEVAIQDQPPDTVGGAFGEDWNLESGSEDWNALADEFIDWLSTADNNMGSAMTMRHSANLSTGVLATRTYTGLDAQVQVGLLRYEGQEFNDEMGEITNLSVHTQETGTLNVTIEDWNTIAAGASDEDWNALSGNEDWGEGVVSSTDYDTLVIATKDGTVVFNSVTPTLAQDAGATRYFTCLIQGIFNIVDLQANTNGQSFHLKSLEAAGNVAGRL